MRAESLSSHLTLQAQFVKTPILTANTKEAFLTNNFPRSLSRMGNNCQGPGISEIEQNNSGLSRCDGWPPFALPCGAPRPPLPPPSSCLVFSFLFQLPDSLTSSALTCQNQSKLCHSRATLKQLRFLSHFADLDRMRSVLLALLSSAAVRWSKLPHLQRQQAPTHWPLTETAK